MPAIRKRSGLMLNLLVLLLALSGCQPVSDARSEFCAELRDIGAMATELRLAKSDDPVSKYQGTIDSLAARKRNVDRLAKLTSVAAIDHLDIALDKVALAYVSVQNNVLGPVADKLTAASGELQQRYKEINEAVCAAK